MGAGEESAGSLAGAFTIPGYSNAGSIPKSQFVPLFDLQTRTFPHDADGKLILVHWVDQAVSFALGVSQGTFAPQSKLGNRLNKIKRAGGQGLNAAVEDAVREALQALVQRKDIGVTEIIIATPTRGQIYVAVSYMNLRVTNADVSKITFVF